MANTYLELLNHLDSLIPELEKHQVRDEPMVKKEFAPGKFQIHDLDKKGNILIRYELNKIDKRFIIEDAGALLSEWTPRFPKIPPENYGAQIPASESQAALFVSDMHLSDSSVGDDFHFDHLKPMPAGNGFVGNPAQGPSKWVLFQHVVSFVNSELSNLGIDHFDTVLNGDIYDYWEMKGRGTVISSDHNGFAAICGTLLHLNNPVYYVRGNHDSNIPDGPWTKVEKYVNKVIRVKAEHGHHTDPVNVGVDNPMGRSLSRAVAIMEQVKVDHNNSHVYPLSGVDNVRPIHDRPAFFRNRTEHFKLLKLQLGRLSHLYQSIFKKKSLWRNFSRSAMQYLRAMLSGYLKVEGHSHDVEQWPGVYYNTGTWNGKLSIASNGKESYSEECPFLLIYKDPDTGDRVERFLVVVRHD